MGTAVAPLPHSCIAHVPLPPGAARGMCAVPLGRIGRPRSHQSENRLTWAGALLPGLARLAASACQQAAQAVCMYVNPRRWSGATTEEVLGCHAAAGLCMPRQALARKVDRGDCGPPSCTDFAPCHDRRRWQAEIGRPRASGACVLCSSQCFAWNGRGGGQGVNPMRMSNSVQHIGHTHTHSDVYRCPSDRRGLGGRTAAVRGHPGAADARLERAGRRQGPQGARDAHGGCEGQAAGADAERQRRPRCRFQPRVQQGHQCGCAHARSGASHLCPAPCCLPSMRVGAQACGSCCLFLVNLLSYMWCTGTRVALFIFLWSLDAPLHRGRCTGSQGELVIFYLVASGAHVCGRRRMLQPGPAKALCKYIITEAIWDADPAASPPAALLMPFPAECGSCCLRAGRSGWHHGARGAVEAGAHWSLLRGGRLAHGRAVCGRGGSVCRTGGTHSRAC